MSPYVTASFGNNTWKSMTKLGAHKRPNWESDTTEFFQYQKPPIDTTANIKRNVDSAYAAEQSQLI